MKLRVGIIGLGVGEAHIKGYSDHPRCEVVALCDFSDEKLKAAGKEYPGLKFTKNAEEILRDPEINVVSIASYDNYHYEHIIKAVSNGKHVFVEKPLCLYRKQAEHIRDAFGAKPYLKLSSNLILRRSPLFSLLKQRIKDGKMGALFHVEGDYNYGRLHKITQGWRGDLDFYSVICGGGVHIIDLLLWLTSDKVVEVQAYGNNISSRGTKFKGNDVVTGILLFESGMTGKVTVNFGCVCPHFHGLTLYGTNATFVNNLEYGIFYESRDKDAEPKKIYEKYSGMHKGGLIYGFVESILGNAEPEVPKEDVFRAMSVCFALEEAVKNRKPTKVKYI